MIGSLLVSAALVFTGADADFAYTCATNFVGQFPARDSGTVSGHLAANWILDTASMTGADVRREKFQDSSRSFTNVYALFKRDPAAPWVFFLSHFDTKPGVNCPGANDGGSTTGILLALVTALTDRGYDGKANIGLMWLDGEECVKSYGPEDGLWGSRHAAEELQRRELNVRAVVCLDMLGDRNLAITIPSNGSPTLMKIAKIAAARADVPVSLISETMKDDHVAFLEAGYSAIDLIDFDYGSASGKNDWWHTPQDSTDKLCRDSLLKSGRLVVELINILAK